MELYADFAISLTVLGSLIFLKKGVTITWVYQPVDKAQKTTAAINAKPLEVWNSEEPWKDLIIPISPLHPSPHIEKMISITKTRKRKRSRV